MPMPTQTMWYVGGCVVVWSDCRGNVKDVRVSLVLCFHMPCCVPHHVPYDPSSFSTLRLHNTNNTQALANACMDSEPENRPTFADIVTRLNKMAGDLGHGPV